MLEAVKRALASGGTLVMDLMDGEWMRRHFDPRSWEWIDRNHFVCRERDLAEDHGDRLISREVVVHAERKILEIFDLRFLRVEEILEIFDSKISKSRRDLRNLRF